MGESPCAVAARVELRFRSYLLTLGLLPCSDEDPFRPRSEVANFAVVEFALAAGGTHRQRVTYAGPMEGPSQLIPRAAKAAKRRRVLVANALRITRGDHVLFSSVADTAKGW